MKLSCLPVSLYGDIFSGEKSVEDWIRFAAGLGLNGVDFSVKFFEGQPSEQLRSIREAAEELNIALCTLACYSDFTHPDAVQRDLEIRRIKADLQLAATLDMQFIRITAGQNHPGLNRAEGVKWVVEGFRYALDEADRLGLTLAYENHTKGAPWQYWDFSQPSGIFLEILNQLSDTPLKVCFDTANPLVINEDPIALLEAVIDKVVVVHAFDMLAKGRFEPAPVGAGISPIKQAFSILKRRGFDGWISVEEASKSGVEGFERAIAFTRQAWREA
jgi:sugar phosphate isomerase/epimerase